MDLRNYRKICYLVPSEREQVDVTKTITTAVNIVLDEHLTLLDQSKLCAVNSDPVSCDKSYYFMSCGLS